MNFIDFESLLAREHAIANEFNSMVPFRFISIEGFFKPDKLPQIHDSYPTITDGLWDGKTYIDQRNKFQKTTFEKDSVFNQVFRELNSPEFLHWLERITGIDSLIADEELFGGGLHQSTTGAFLNVHVDYNVHPKTKLHRRLNVLVYMNHDWNDAYEGHLELWDFSNEKKVMIGKFAPTLNRCVIFETNEISYHGHPKPLKTPSGVNRKSIATYYYTKSRPEGEMVDEHNTRYVNTEGSLGSMKRFGSGLKALVERIFG